MCACACDGEQSREEAVMEARNTHTPHELL